MKQVREEPSSVATVEGDRVIPLAADSKIGSLTSFIVIAAGILLSVLIGWMALLWRDNALAKAELAGLKQEIQLTEQQLVREREIVDILSSPEAKVAELSGTSSAPAAHATLAYNPNGEGILLARGLPAAPESKGYQLWFIVDGQLIPGKVFNTDNSGIGTLRTQLPAEMKDKPVFAITLEPIGGVRTPTGAILLRSEL